ncbi:hypothetical protein BASA81_000893 [Batrachochytrium salamandrivorans]|nr:hypothetical protein BASA81_000893 [Batrachochytrium salamandrivorans]
MNFLNTAKEALAALLERKEELEDLVKAKTERVHQLSQPQIVLSNTESISNKMRACFYLRSENTDAAAMVLLRVTAKKGESVLLRHEAGYCLGQMKRDCVQAGLQQVLQDCTDDAIVRHECAEALGSIGNPVCIPLLEQIANNPGETREVRETCEIALDRFKDLGEGFDKSLGEEEGFNTSDPAIASKAAVGKRVAQVCELEADMSDLESSLYERYKAMFALRNRSMFAKTDKEKEDAVLALSRGLLDDKQGALFRHEVAFVLGQVSHPASVPYLKQAMADLTLHDMVRHEAAEALGGVGNEESLAALEGYLANNAEAVIVRESCEVALDAAEYWKEFEQK